MARSVYVIAATRAPVAAVIRRTPKKWTHVMRWDLATGEIEPGAWIHATLYPRRCDLSPDGLYFYAFLARSITKPFMGERGYVTYSSVSKLPWLFALAAWHGAAPRGVEMRAPTYRVESPKKKPIELDDVTWADWDSVGRLLLVTKKGHVQIRNADRPDLPLISDRDACAFEIDPKEAPKRARHY